MLKAVLIDLDNTMVLFDEPTFHQRLMSAIGESLSDLDGPEEVRRRTIRGVAALRPNSGTQFNRSAFLNAFCEGLAVAETRVWGRIRAFYGTPYDRLRPEIRTPPGLRRILKWLHQRGLAVVVATNPIYPLAAVETRIQWAGLKPDAFDLITHLENMRFVKPQKGYYRQICNIIGVDPEACLMAGNDPVNDMAAAEVGMTTYRTTDADATECFSLSLTADNDDDLPQPHHTGPFAGLAKVAEGLM